MENNKKFVIQEHTKAGEIHWDLMLEKTDALETYRLNIPPEQLADGKTALAEKIFDHDLKFLTYEGPVNKGQGKVKITDSGVYEIFCISENKTEINFSGKILKGRFSLVTIEQNKFQLIMLSQLR